MIAGHLQEKNDFYYVVLNYKDSAGKRHTKWCRTGLPVKGNKKRAEAVLMELRLSFDPEAEEAARRIRKGESPALDFEMAQSEGGRLLFADYLEQWLKVARSTVKTITYSGYAEGVQKRISPWFRERGIALTELQASDIQDFYSFRLETVKATTVIHDHAVIHRALKYAVKMDMIPVNPADKVERPRKEAFQASFYDRNELNRLFEAAKGTRLEIPVMLAAFYGLRRSEVLGLRWDAIDFDNDTITIRHTVTSFNMDGKHMLIASDTTKLGGGDAGGTGFEGLGGIKRLRLTVIRRSLAEAVGFEPTCPLGQLHFECSSLRPLRYASTLLSLHQPRILERTDGENEAIHLFAKTLKTLAASRFSGSGLPTWTADFELFGQFGIPWNFAEIPGI